MKEYRQWVQNTQDAKILSKHFRMWSFVQHSLMLQVLKFNAGTVQGYKLLGWGHINWQWVPHMWQEHTASMFKGLVTVWQEQQCRAGWDKQCSLPKTWRWHIQHWYLLEITILKIPPPNFRKYTKYSKNIPRLTTLSTVPTTLV